MPTLFEVRWAEALVDHGPELLCADCLEQLRERAREYVEGRALSDFVWAIEIIREFGGSAPSRPRRSSRSSRKEAVAPGGIVV